MDASLGLALPQHSATRGASVPVTVAVGHRSTVVAAGLAATLVRTPGCDIQLSQVSTHKCTSQCPHTAQLIFGDAALLRHLRSLPGESPSTCALAHAKFVWVTAGDEPVAHAAKAAGDIDELVPLECPENELFAVVQRLIGFDPACLKDGSGPAFKSPRHQPRGGLAPGALRRVREFVENQIAESIHVEDLAGIAGLSLGHFNRAFRQSLGLSPHRYVMQRRVAIAANLLCKTARALADIALDVGFADQSHFSRTFVAVNGETPSACRRRHR